MNVFFKIGWYDHVKYTILLKYTIVAEVYDLHWKYNIQFLIRN